MNSWHVVPHAYRNQLLLLYRETGIDHGVSSNAGVGHHVDSRGECCLGAVFARYIRMISDVYR